MPSTAPDSPGTSRPPVLALLRTSLPTLPPQLKRLAVIALESPADVGRMTITEFAERAGASAASVTRLCRSLGIEKFTTLRTELVLAAERPSAGSAPQVTGDITATTPLPDLIGSLGVLSAGSIEETSRLLDPEEIGTIAQALGDAEHVFATGAGSLHLVAVSIEHKLRSLGIPATTFHDPPSAVIGLAASRPGDVLVAVSETGTESETVPQLTEARRRGCRTVLITRLSSSPAAELADHVLLAVQDRSPLHTGTLTSRIAELFLADVLTSGVVVRHHERSIEALASVEETLERYW